MVKVSIVEDENAAAQILKEYLVRYTSDRGIEFDIHTYKEAYLIYQRNFPIQIAFDNLMEIQ